MDETPVWFDMTENFSINQKEEKTVHICEIDNENNWFTVILTCAASKDLYSSVIFNELFLISNFFLLTDGSKLPPIFIFKGKQMPRGEEAPPDVVVWFQESGWIWWNAMLITLIVWEDHITNTDFRPWWYMILLGDI